MMFGTMKRERMHAVRNMIEAMGGLGHLGYLLVSGTDGKPITKL